MNAQFLRTFFVPLLVVVGMVSYGILLLVGMPFFATVVILASVLLGTWEMLHDTLISLSKRQFALDYIAIVAIVVALITNEYLVAGILALMITTGRTLEDYGVSQAKKSLTQLINRIPTDVTLWEHGQPGKKAKLSHITMGQKVFIRKGEVIGLDGILESKTGQTDESSLTGEPYFIDKVSGDVIRSGTINIGEAMVIRVTKTEKDSTYKKIIDMVRNAQDEKSPFIRLADQYTTVFTITTFSIAGLAYFLSGFDLSRVLAVLAVATPCPLIIATPIALLGGVNASAKQKIIVKRLASLEVLARINALLFDKTGTITLGVPVLHNIVIEDSSYSRKTVLAIAAAIERNSLHPLAKAIIFSAHEHGAETLVAEHVTEKIGSGISGTVQGKMYTITRLTAQQGMGVALFVGTKRIALFQFEDTIKQYTKPIIRNFLSQGLLLKILTGDRQEAAEKIVRSLGVDVQIRAHSTPQDKQEEIVKLKKNGNVVAMVGDGINDAPALALADVGLAFSNQEQTAASEAADIVLLGGDFSMVLRSYEIAKRTIAIAKQSIVWGIGLSVAAMVLAAIGLVPPLVGAGLQEAIDVAVILNALRASR